MPEQDQLNSIADQLRSVLEELRSRLPELFPQDDAPAPESATETVGTGDFLTLPQQTVPENTNFFSTDDLALDPLVFPEGVGLDPVSPFVSGINALNQQTNAFIAQQQEALAPFQQERDELNQQLVDNLQLLENQGDRQLEIEEELGLPDLRNNLTELNTQITELTTAFDQAELDIENNRGTLLGSAPKISGIRRQRAAELGALAATAQALQGNIALAQDTANRTVDIEFGGIEEQINTIQQILDINAENFGLLEQQQAEQLSLFLDSRQEIVQLAKEERREIIDIALDAAQAGAGTQTLNSILNSASLNQAFSFAQGFLGSSSGFGAPAVAQQPISIDAGSGQSVNVPQSSTVLSRDEFREVAQQDLLQTLSEPALDDLYNQYLAQTQSTAPDLGDFTNTQQLKLEQAGLLASPRQDQLDFLFGGSGLDFSISDDLISQAINDIL